MMGNPTKFQEQEVNHDNYKAMERGAYVARKFGEAVVAVGAITVATVIPKVAKVAKEVLPRVSASIFKATPHICIK